MLLVKALRGEPRARTPVWLMRQAGRYLPEYREIRAGAGNFLDLCYTPALAAEVTLQPVRRFGVDGAILFSDILVIPDALGQSVAFEEGEGPVLGAIGPGDVAGLNEGGVVDRLAPVLETVERVRGALDDDVALIGFAGAPWTVATYMVEGRSSRDYAAVKGWAFRDPDGFSELIDVLTRATTAYLIAQIQAGANVVQLFDSWAGVLPEWAFRRWAEAPARAIVEGIRAVAPDVPIIGFPRGAGALVLGYAATTGVDGLGLDQAVPLAWTRQELQGQVAVQGNLDPIALLAGGSAMTGAAKEILENLAAGPFVFNLGHGVIPATPPEHVGELVTFVQGWS